MAEREHKFRGKRKDNGNWVYGYYIGKTSEDTKLFDYAIMSINNHCEYEVDSETVGEYTGRPDKNGKDAYEHDIVKGKWPYSSIGIITWNKDRCGFYIQPIDGLQKAAYDKGYKLNGTKFEIIGNLHDNPELLEAK